MEPAAPLMNNGETPGGTATSKLDEVPSTLVNGRASTAVPSADAAVKLVVCGPRNMYSPSRPHRWQLPSQIPAANRPPLKLSVLTGTPPKRTAVPGPMAPGDVPTAGPVVTSGGVGEPRRNHSKYSPRTHTRSSGQVVPQPPPTITALAGPGGVASEPGAAGPPFAPATYGLST